MVVQFYRIAVLCAVEKPLRVVSWWDVLLCHTIQMEIDSGQLPIIQKWQLNYLEVFRS